MSYTCAKEYMNLPAAHRQHSHDGHCALIHGHNWGFKITFTSDELDVNGFVVDFGRLKFIKEWLDDTFDHTLLLNEEDPYLTHFKQGLGDLGFAKITIVENCGAEKLAEHVFKNVNRLLAENGLPNARVTRVVCFEDSKNSATYTE